MDKKLRNLIVGGVVLLTLTAALVILYLFPDGSNGDSDSLSDPQDLIILIDKSIYDIKQVEIFNQDGNYTVIRDENEHLSVEGYGDLPLDEEILVSIVTSSSIVAASAIVEEEPEDIGRYGFDQPLSKVTVRFSDGSSAGFSFGIKHPTGVNSYFMMDGSDEVYLVEAWLYDEIFSKSIHDLIQKTLIPSDWEVETENGYVVDYISVSGRGMDRPVTFTKSINRTSLESETGAAVLYMTKPVEALLNPIEVGRLVEIIPGYWADFAAVIRPTAAQTAEFGFDDPLYVVELSVDGKEVTLTFGNQFKKEMRNEDGSVYNVSFNYVKSSLVDDVVFGIYMEDMIFNINPDRYLNIHALMIFIDDVYEIEYKTSDKTLLMELSGKGEDLTVRINQKTIETRRFRDYFGLLISAPSRKIYYDTPRGTPDLTITYKYRNTEWGSEVINFYRTDNMEVITEINGKARFIGASGYLEQLIKQTELIEQNMDVTMGF